MTTPTHKMLRTPTLDRDGAFSIVRDMGKTLRAAKMEIDHTQENGVKLFIPYQVIVTHSDFNLLMMIFDKSSWGPKLLSQALVDREKVSYEAHVRAAITEYFPEFLDT